MIVDLAGGSAQQSSLEAKNKLRLSLWSPDQDPAIGAVAIQILRELVVDDDAAVIAGRRSVHEMQHAVTRAQCQADMRGRIKSVSLPRNDADNIATSEFRLNGCDLAFWNLIERQR